MSTIDYGACPDYITFQFCHFGGTYRNYYVSNIPTEAIYFGGFSGDICQHWTIQYCFFHNVQYAGQMAGVNDIVWAYNAAQHTWGKETFRGQNTATNVIFKYNKLVDT
jgi:hypothetical protein